MSIHFERKHKPMRELPLAAMIDVVFILIFFFMLTTSFIKIESMQLMLPSSNQEATSAPVTAIVLRGDDYIKFAGRVIAPKELADNLQQALQTNPDMAFNVQMDDTVSLQRMVLVMDQISAMGGNHVAVQPLAGAAP